MKINKDFYYPMSENFRQQIMDSILEAEAKQAKPTFISFKRVAIALASLLILIPISIFGVSKTIDYFSSMKQTANFAYQPNFKTEDETGKKLSNPEYVKLNFNPDEKYIAENSDKFSYLFADRNETAFSFSLIRPTDGKVQSMFSMKTYHKITINGNEGFFIDPAGHVKASRVYLFFEKVNMVVVGYFSPDLTEAEVISILERVEVTEGTKENQTLYGIYDPSVPEYFPAENTLSDGSRYRNSILTLEGEEMDIAVSKVYATVNKIYVETNVGERDRNDFLIGDHPYEIQLDEKGNVLPRITEKWSYEKGKVEGYDYLPTYLGEAEHERVFVFAEITYKNITNEIQNFPLSHDLCLFSRVEDGKMYYSEANAGEKYFSAEGENPIYIEGAEPFDPQTMTDDQQPALSFYVGLLQPGETRTITLGWVCDAELIDQAYLSFSQHYYGGSNHLPYYNIKVVK